MRGFIYRTLPWMFAAYIVVDICFLKVRQQAAIDRQIEETFNNVSNRKGG